MNRPWGALLLVFCAAGLSAGPATSERPADPRLSGAFRRPPANGWIFAHLEGDPSSVGYQNGYLLAPEIADSFRVVRAGMLHGSSHDWAFYRAAAEHVLWPHIEKEYREELQGITAGLLARQVPNMDLWDVVAYNAFQELDSYYSNWYDRQHHIAAVRRPTPEHCSAFVATGSYTRDGKIIIAHNNWSQYREGSRWNIILDIVPSSGYRILMDALPGMIHSGDDFGENSAGMLITETTISSFDGFDPDGVAEFVRARKAMQYSASIHDFARIMKDGNNGGYANTWLLADRNTNEIGELELGLLHVTLKTSRDGYFAGANFPQNPELIRDEAFSFSVRDMGISPNARRKRWDELMAGYKGKIDVSAAGKFLADHYDTFEGREAPSERTLCGHVDLSPRGSPPWQPAHGTAGAVENKVSDASLSAQMAFIAAMGHACGRKFNAAEHVRKYPAFTWEKDLLKDLDSYPWTKFQAAQGGEASARVSGVHPRGAAR